MVYVLVACSPAQCPELRNLVLAVDQTMAIESWNSGVKNILRQLVDRFIVQPDWWTEGALALYGARLNTEGSRVFSQLRTEGDLLRAIQNNVGPEGGEPNQAVMLDDIRNRFFTTSSGYNPDSRKVAIVFTSGQDNSGRLQRAIDDARRANIEVIVVSLTSTNRELSNLQRMDKDGQPILGGLSANEIPNLVDRIVRRVCPAELRSNYLY